MRKKERIVRETERWIDRDSGDMKQKNQMGMPENGWGRNNPSRRKCFNEVLLNNSSSLNDRKRQAPVLVLNILTCANELGGIF